MLQLKFAFLFFFFILLSGVSYLTSQAGQSSMDASGKVTVVTFFVIPRTL